jgi:hypothetical protein
MREISKDELDEILEKHKMWFNCEEGGEQADLREANLWGANLYGDNLQKANLFRAYLREADLRVSNLRGVDLREANLLGVNLFGAYLYEADLRGANIDFSVLPLWCGSLDMKVDTKIAAQIAYHFCRLKCDNEEFIKFRNGLLDFGNKFHRAGEGGCSILKPI